MGTDIFISISACNLFMVLHTPSCLHNTCLLDARGEYIAMSEHVHFSPQQLLNEDQQ